ncbi:hypothetical protein COLO4_09823 [Corchorus olitorius]|uniref:Uncharacterized protein n=1 Tax=Corchorus olitorius TaxID=93759 RepID=A0A1R3KAW5_9ROSI|nr:hypothetical protein COLO4_09823 [Corchorus olitorius]
MALAPQALPGETGSEIWLLKSHGPPFTKFSRPGL